MTEFTAIRTLHSYNAIEDDGEYLDERLHTAFLCETEYSGRVGDLVVFEIHPGSTLRKYNSGDPSDCQIALPDLANHWHIRFTLYGMNKMTQKFMAKIVTAYNISPKFLWHCACDRMYEEASFGSVIQTRTLYSDDGVCCFDFWYQMPVRQHSKLPSKDVESWTDLPNSDPQSQLFMGSTNTLVSPDNCTVYMSLKMLPGKPAGINGLILPQGDAEQSLIHKAILRRMEDATEKPMLLETFNIDPFEIHLLILSEVFKVYRDTIRAMAPGITNYEREAASIGRDTTSHDKKDFRRTQLLHAVAAHLSRYHVELSLCNQIAIDLREQHDRYFGGKERPTRYWQVEEQLRFWMEHARETRTVVQEYLKRVEICINLCTSSMAQVFGSLTMASNASMATIALETRRDSASMKTIAIVTMIYLPGAFVAAVFGMSIIDFQVDDQGRQQTVVGNHWKTFVAIALALTATTLAFWWITEHFREKKAQREAEVEGEGEGEKDA